MIVDETTREAIRDAIRSVLAGERYPGYFGDTIDACTRAVEAALASDARPPDDGA